MDTNIEEMAQRIYNAFPALMHSDWWSFNMFVNEMELWANNRHHGHCVDKQSMVCKRCVLEQYYKFAEKLFDETRKLGISENTLKNLPNESFLKLVWTLIHKDLKALRDLGVEMYVYCIDIKMEKYTSTQVKGLANAEKFTKVEDQG